MSATDVDTASASCMGSCLPSFCRGKKSSREKSIQPDKGGNQDGDRRRSSVYYSALQTHTLNDDELAALKELEEAAADGDGSPSRESMYFFDAVDEIGGDGSVTSMTYPPAPCPDPHPRASLIMDDPATLLRAKKPPVRGLSTRRSSMARLLKASRRATVDELQGYPGELTESEVEAAIKFRSELKRKSVEEEDGNAYEDMVRAFKKVEEVRLVMGSIDRPCSCQCYTTCDSHHFCLLLLFVAGAVCIVPISTVEEL